MYLWPVEQECQEKGGGDSSIVIPIAVGSALGAILFVTIIAFVVARGRRPRRGYHAI
jgi:hypothetical protein